MTAAIQQAENQDKGESIPSAGLLTEEELDAIRDLSEKQLKDARDDDEKRNELIGIFIAKFGEDFLERLVNTPLGRYGIELQTLITQLSDLAIAYQRDQAAASQLDRDIEMWRAKWSAPGAIPPSMPSPDMSADEIRVILEVNQHMQGLAKTVGKLNEQENAGRRRAKNSQEKIRHKLEEILKPFNSMNEIELKSLSGQYLDNNDEITLEKLRELEETLLNNSTGAGKYSADKVFQLQRAAEEVKQLRLKTKRHPVHHLGIQFAKGAANSSNNFGYAVLGGFAMIGLLHLVASTAAFASLAPFLADTSIAGSLVMSALAPASYLLVRWASKNFIFEPINNVLAYLDTKINARGDTGGTTQLAKINAEKRTTTQSSELGGVVSGYVGAGTSVVAYAFPNITNTIGVGYHAAVDPVGNGIVSLGNVFSNAVGFNSSWLNQITPILDNQIWMFDALGFGLTLGITYIAINALYKIGKSAYENRQEKRQNARNTYEAYENAFEDRGGTDWQRITTRTSSPAPR